MHSANGFELPARAAFADYWSKLKVILEPFAPAFIKLNLITIAIESTSLLFPLLVAFIATGIEKHLLADAYWGVAGIAAFLVARSVLEIVRFDYGYSRIDTPLCRKIDELSLKKLSELSLGRLKSEEDRNEQILQNGRRAITASFNALSYRIIPAFTGIIVLVGILFRKSAVVGSIALAGFLVFALRSFLFIKKTLPHIRSYTESENKIETCFLERVKNMASAVFYGHHEVEIAKHVILHRENSAAGRRLWRNDYLVKMAVLRDPVSLVSLSALILVSINGVTQGKLSLPDFFVITWCSSGAFAAMVGITSVKRDLMEHWGRIADHIDFLFDPIRPGEERIAAGAFQDLEFKSVSFRADPKDPFSKLILDDVSFKIRKGEFVALVGPSGSGKSTCTSLALGSHFAGQGEVRVNGINMRVVDLQSWRPRVGFVEQTPALWDRPIAENIQCYRQGITPEKIVEVLRTVGLYEAFCLPDKEGKVRMSEPIGLDGCKLSGGERQRLAIARAIICDPEILVFDEAMTGLDSENEGLILNLLRVLALKRRYTIVVVAHKLVTVRMADKIIVLEKGKVIDIGRHEELEKRCKVYARLLLLESLNSELCESVPPEPAEAMVA